MTVAANATSVGVTYDALGRMVEANRGGAFTQVLYGPDGSKLALMNGQTLQKAFVALPAGATAVYAASGLSYYQHADWLGTSRLASTAARGVYYDGAYAPFGESYAETGATDRSFTGQTQDTVTGLYDFLFRHYHPVAGRWISPDPAGMSAVDITNPQSWNRYAYVGNSPLTSVDPLGLCDPKLDPWQCEGVPPNPDFIKDVKAPRDTAPTNEFVPMMLAACTWFGICAPLNSPAIYLKPAPGDRRAAANNGNTYWNAFKHIHHCAAARANSLSLAALTGTQDTVLGQLFLTNDVSNIENLGENFNAQTLAGVTTSNPLSKDLVHAAGDLIGNAPNITQAVRYVVRFNSAGTPYVAAAGRPTIASSGLFGGLGRAVSKMFGYKAVYDGIVYTGAMFSCAEF